MRIYLQIQAEADKPPRYYQLLLQQDLLGGWGLVREWGVQGARGRVKKEFFEEHDAAMDALLLARDAQVKRGFRVVFVEGAKLGTE